MPYSKYKFHLENKFLVKNITKCKQNTQHISILFSTI